MPLDHCCYTWHWVRAREYRKQGEVYSCDKWLTPLMNFASDWANKILQDKPSSGCHCVCPPGATGGVSETVTTNTPSQPEAPVGSVVTETPTTTPTTSTTTLTTASATSLPSTPDTRTTEATTVEQEESVTSKLSKLTYKEACGRTPWLDEEFRASQARPRLGQDGSSWNLRNSNYKISGANGDQFRCVL